MAEDIEIVTRFIRLQLNVKEIKITATREATMLAREVVEIFPDIKPKRKEDIEGITWSEIINQKRELWPIQYLLPGGGFIR
jgi:hypothetical protein